MKNRNNDNDCERRERHERFRRNLDQVNAYRFGEGAAVPPFRPFPHLDFMPDALIKAISISAPAMRGDGDAVTIPRNEYDGLLAAKVTLGLLMNAAETETLSRYNIADVIAMIANGGKGDGATADA